MFFSLAPDSAIVSDANARLVETYQIIRDNWRALLDQLVEHHRLHSKEYYYDQRDAEPQTPTARASQFIYLNRACWNGLYRVNRRGKFNVPIGTKNWIVSDTDNFEGLSNTLKGASIRCCDFAETIDLAGPGDLVFVDPPYTVAHNFNGFVKYNDKIFSWSDQERLRSRVEAAAERGATVVMTNADHESVRDLYRDLAVPQIIDRHSIISGSSAARRKTTEAIYVISP